MGEDNVEERLVGSETFDQSEEPAPIQDLLAQPPRQQQKSAKNVGKVVLSFAAFCATVWAGDKWSQYRARGRAERHAAVQNGEELVQIIAKPKRGACSKWNEDCFSTGCCAVVGYNCFTTEPGRAQCSKNCTPSPVRSCTQPQGIMDHILQDAVHQGTFLYCFSVYTKNTGSTKPSYELDILKYAHAKQASIFACDRSDVFSDVSVEVGPNLHTIMVKDVEGDFHFAKRKVSGTWVNTGMFTQVWRAIAARGAYQQANWVAKVDADAVFVPNRLRKWLSTQRVPTPGVYLENCKFVDYGYFGNLEVYSQAAFQTLLQNIDMCKATLKWKEGIKNGKYGPMGEDLFAQTCLDKVGVRRIEAFDIAVDGACPADRPKDQEDNKKWKPDCHYVSTPSMHPFKLLGEWINCHAATVEAFGN